MNANAPRSAPDGAPRQHDGAISCIIPTHRRGEFLREALESVISQTLPPTEIIVVSDVKDDQARAVCDAVGTGASVLVRYIERVEGGGGASASRNHGASLARSELLAFLDDDDRWSETFLDHTYRALTGSDAGIAVAWITEFSAEHQRNGHAIVPGLEAADVLAVNPGITGSNFLVRSERFHALGGFDEALPVKNDTDFFARFMRDGGDYIVVPERLVFQRKHQLGQLTAVDERRARGTELFMAKHREHLSRADRRELVQLVHRIRSRCAPTRPQRLYHLAWVAVLYGPVGLVRKLRRGRERPVYDVGSAHDGA